MGITIHYDYEIETTIDDFKGIIQNIHREIKELPIRDITPIGLFDDALDGEEQWKEKDGIGFYVDVMKGSEPFYVILFPRGDINSDDKIRFSSSHFTKTQFCEDFEKGHKLVIQMLEICEKYGILKKVHDEAGYWDSNNDQELKENYKQSAEMINAFGNFLKSQGFGNFISGADLEHPDFEISDFKNKDKKK